MMRATRDQTTENLVSAAKSIACWGAKTYLEANELTADTDDLARAIVSNLNRMIPLAIEDAKEALDVGMDDVAVETFRVSIVLAGVEAARECSCR